MQHHSFFKNLSSLSKVTRATSLKIGASYAKNWAGDLLVRIYPQLRINKSDIPNTVSYYYKKLLNIDNSKCIIRHYTKKKRSQIHNLTQFETSKNLITWIIQPHGYEQVSELSYRLQQVNAVIRMLEKFFLKSDPKEKIWRVV